MEKILETRLSLAFAVPVVPVQLDGGDGEVEGLLRPDEYACGLGESGSRLRPARAAPHEGGVACFPFLFHCDEGDVIYLGPGAVLAASGDGEFELLGHVEEVGVPDEELSELIHQGAPVQHLALLDPGDRAADDVPNVPVAGPPEPLAAHVGSEPDPVQLSEHLEGFIGPDPVELDALAVRDLRFTPPVYLA